MKIYTKTGDKGSTSLASGTRVAKTHTRIEAYGTVDELTSYVALLRDLSTSDEMKSTLLEVLDRLMTLGGQLSFDKLNEKLRLPSIKEEDVVFLENKIDEYSEQLPPLHSFVIPGGCALSSHCHIARSICRRAERMTIRLNENCEVPEFCIQYLNRLSDFLFVLARKSVHDAKAVEITWKPRID